MKIMIKATNLKLQQDVRELVQQKIAPLKKYFDRILEAHVEVERADQHHRKGDVFRAECLLKVPHRGTIYAEARGENLHNALSELKKILRREINEYKNKMQHMPRKDAARAKRELLDQAAKRAFEGEE